MMHSGSIEGSWVDSQPDSEVELDFEPSSATDSGFVADFDSTIGSDSTTEEHFMHAILRLVVDSSFQYDKLQYIIYMNTTIVGNLSGNV